MGLWDDIWQGAADVLDTAGATLGGAGAVAACSLAFPPASPACLAAGAIGAYAGDKAAGGARRVVSRNVERWLEAGAQGAPPIPLTVGPTGDAPSLYSEGPRGDAAHLVALEQGEARRARTRAVLWATIAILATAGTVAYVQGR